MIDLAKVLKRSKMRYSFRWPFEKRRWFDARRKQSKGHSQRQEVGSRISQTSFLLVERLTCLSSIVWKEHTGESGMFFPLQGSAPSRKLCIFKKLRS